MLARSRCVVRIVAGSSLKPRSELRGDARTSRRMLLALDAERCGRADPERACSFVS